MTVATVTDEASMTVTDGMLEQARTLAAQIVAAHGERFLTLLFTRAPRLWNRSTFHAHHLPYKDG